MDVPATRFDDWPAWRYIAIVPVILIAGLVAIVVGAACLVGVVWFFTLLPLWAGLTVDLVLFVWAFVRIRTLRARHRGSE